MLFSVIVPVYKVEKYLKECVDSILKQSFKDFELILVDDGSPDSCPQICDDYSRVDDRVKVIHKENGGLSSARNIGLEHAKGDYIVYLDSDDFFLNNLSLEHIANKTVSNPDIIMYKTATCDELARQISYPKMELNYDSDLIALDEMLSKTISGEEFQASAWSKAVRRELLINHGISFKDKLLGEDTDWYIEVIRNVRSYATVDEYLYVYRNRQSSITKTFGLKNLTDLIWILNKWNSILGTEGRDLSLRHYLGKTYVSLLIVYASISDVKKKSYKNQIKGMNSLLHYDSHPRTKVVAGFYKFFGFNITVLLLKILLKLRK